MGLVSMSGFNDDMRLYEWVSIWVVRVMNRALNLLIDY